MGAVELARIDLPEFGAPAIEPAIPRGTYEARIASARARAAAAGLDALIVYADREHAANLAYLTGYDPRFEEALLVLVADRPPILLVGNEGRGYAGIAPVELDIVLFQSFSLLGQPRGDSEPLADILRAAGLQPAGRIGVAGWKYFGPGEGAEPGNRLEVPSYIVDVLRQLAGERGAVVNETALFMDSANGLRSTSDVDQLARFEFAACHTSRCPFPTPGCPLITRRTWSWKCGPA